jgi:hypothetical protein
MHRSQLTASERARLKQERAANAGTRNLDGSVSYFHQMRDDKCPTSEEVKSAVQWGRAETNDGTRHTWGPDVATILSKLPP